MSDERSPQKRLSKGNLRFTRAGLLLAIVTLITFVPAYLLSVTLMFLMGSLLSGLLVYNFFAVLRSLRHLQPQLAHLDEFFAMGEARAHLLLKLNKRGHIHHLNLVLHGQNFADAQAVIASVHGGETLAVTLSLTPKGRGWATITHCTLAISHPFGLVRSSREFELNQKFLVYPSLLQSHGEALLSNQETQGTVPRSSDDFVYLTAYQPGEDVRRIHWKKSTLLEQPVLRKDLGNLDVVVPRLFVPDPCPHFEYAISVMATHFSTEQHMSDWQVLTPDGLVTVRSREEMLEVLALLTPVSSGTELYEDMNCPIIFASQITPE